MEAVPVQKMEIFFDARPDAEDTEEAINKFLEGLESQEEAGFDRLHSLLTAQQASRSCCRPWQQYVAC